MMSKDNDIVITFKTNLYFIADHDRKPTENGVNKNSPCRIKSGE